MNYIAQIAPITNETNYSKNDQWIEKKELPL